MDTLTPLRDGSVGRSRAQGSRLRRLALAASALLLAACGGESEMGYARTQRPRADATPSPSPSVPPVESAKPEGAAGRSNAEESADVYVDPGCPEPPVPVRFDECSPLTEVTGCEVGSGCYPFVVYPDAPCEPETYGAVCAPAGVGVQGDPCDSSLCSPGFMCVATGRGTQCAELCPFPGENTCPPGLLCGNVDVEGYGTCF